ncbi:MAG: hypothetical protein Q7S73_00820 [bacterium]|jgi:guanylate kinase|nr:hypothetical protein [bacterium]
MVPEWLKPKTGKEAIVYPAIPSRLLKTHYQEFLEFIRKHKRAPIKTFDAGDLEDFEFGPVGRHDTIYHFTCGLQDLAWETWVGGASEGTLIEAFRRLKNDPEKRLRVFPHLDPKWEEEFEYWKGQLGDPFAELRKSFKTLLVFVGPRTGGKTYLANSLEENPLLKLVKVKNVTTRQPRQDKWDQHCYHFVGRDEFELGKQNCAFLEYDQYPKDVHDGEWYGSSLEEIKSVLRNSHGTMALTPDGVRALYQCRYEINLVIILLRASPEVLVKNAKRRNILDPEKQKEIIRDAKRFVLPADIPHLVYEPTGDERDKKRILKLVEPLLK